MDGVSYFLVFLAVVLIGAALFLGAGITRSGRRRGDGLGEPVANLPPVVVPEHATGQDVDRIKFSLGLRGYRMDQVDQVLDELKNQLESRDREIERLTLALEEERRREPVSDAESSGQGQ